MPRVKIAAAESEPVSVDVEIGRLRDRDVDGLRVRWETVHGKKAAGHLPRHLLLRILAYRLQAERLATWTAKASVSWIDQVRLSEHRSALQMQVVVSTISAPARC